MDPQITAALQGLLTAVVIGIVTLLSLAARKLFILAHQYLEQKLGLDAFTFLKAYVNTTVRFLEQQPFFTDLTGADKRLLAIKDIATWCENNKIPVDEAMIEHLIEEAVKVMNGSKNNESVLTSLTAVEKA